MVLDGHVHIAPGPPEPDRLLGEMTQAGVAGGILISLPPLVFPRAPAVMGDEQRLDNLFAWTASQESLCPFFWIDPLADTAAEQVRLAVARNVAGFKVICDSFYPGNERALETYRAIAAAGKPILFHSGILWDGKPSACYNRPGEFEALLEVPGARFSLAHISWPWCDELIAVYGKFLNAHVKRPDLAVEMFVDLTPGTPAIYRRDALTKLMTAGYDVEHHIVFGTDSDTSGYNHRWAREWIERDKEILRECGVSEKAIDAVQRRNLLRFAGMESTQVERKLPVPAE